MKLIIPLLALILSACSSQSGGPGACSNSYNGQWREVNTGSVLALTDTCKMTLSTCTGSYTYTLDEANYTAYVASGEATNCFSAGTTALSFGVITATGNISLTPMGSNQSMEFERL